MAVRFVQETRFKDLNRGFSQRLFNSAEHRSVQNPENWRSYYLENVESGIISAELHLHIQGKMAKSPALSPFGGLEFSDQLSDEALEGFVAMVEENLKGLNITGLTMKEPPLLYYTSKMARLEKIFRRLGFNKVANDPHWIIQVDSGAFLDQLNSNEYRRKIRKLEREGFSFREYPLSKGKEIRNFIQDCRRERQYRFSMNEKLFQRHLEAIPAHSFLFGVELKGELCAAAICFKVDEHIIYDFSHAHSRKFDRQSPVLLLMNGLYDYGRRHEYRLIDLGASSLAGKPNTSLIQFKEALGAVKSDKITWHKPL